MTERRTPFHAGHLRLGAQLTRGSGDFMCAMRYTSVAEEHLNTRANVGMQDLSTMGKIDIKGPGAEALVNHVLVNDVRSMLPGQVRYSTVCREDGGILDDLTAFRLGAEHFMIVSGSVNRLKMVDWISRHAQGRPAYVTDVTAALAMATIQGPRSRELLKSIVRDADLDALRHFWFAEGRIGDTRVRVSRTGVTGELGFELYIPADEATVMWDFLLEAGADFGLQPYGRLAMFTLGLEKGYPAHGVDMDESRTPFHIGLDRWVHFDKGEFIGREALLRVRDTGVAERWAGLIVAGRTAAAANDRVFAGDREVGFVTYSDEGHSVGRILATAHLKHEVAQPGTELAIVIGGKRSPAKVARMPFFDPEGLRLKA